MTKISYINEVYPTCPIRNILSRISDKWSLVIIFTLSKADGPMRFNALQRENGDISQKVLTSTLRTLEEDGLVERKVYAEVPPRVEYSLTERAETLLPHVNSLIGWAVENMAEILRDRKERMGQRS